MMLCKDAKIMLLLSGLLWLSLLVVGRPCIPVVRVHFWFYTHYPFLEKDFYIFLPKHAFSTLRYGKNSYL